jgi:hypothetical protein
VAYSDTVIGINNIVKQSKNQSVKYRLLLNLSAKLTSEEFLLTCQNVINTSKFRHTVALYGSETWSPTLREEHRLRVCENRVLRRIF